jgi:hypothetical protein
MQSINANHYEELVIRDMAFGTDTRKFGSASADEGCGTIFCYEA